MSRRKITTAEKVESFLLEVMQNKDEEIQYRLEAAKQLQQLGAAKKKNPGLDDWGM